MSSREAQGNRGSFQPAISANGRYVAFSSQASNLTPGDPGHRADIFVRNRATGRTLRIASADGPVGNRGNVSPVISAHGRYVAFVATREDRRLGSESTVFLWDRRDRSLRAVGGRMLRAHEVNGEPAISPHGRYVAFSTDARILPSDRDPSVDVYVEDQKTRTITRVRVGRHDRLRSRSVGSPSVSGGARWIAVVATTGSGATRQTKNAFVWNRRTGVARRVSVTASGDKVRFGVPPDPGQPVDISANGRYVSFISAERLVGRDTNRTWDVYVRDTQIRSTRLVSTSRSGRPANDPSISVAMSAVGHRIAYTSHASNLVPRDTNDQPDIFIAVQ